MSSNNLGPTFHSAFLPSQMTSIIATNSAVVPEGVTMKTASCYFKNLGHLRTLGLGH